MLRGARPPVPKINGLTSVGIVVIVAALSVEEVHEERRAADQERRAKSHHPAETRNLGAEAQSR